MPQDNGIGDLFRTFGEKYIETYKPDQRQIKLIRAIRICKTPALGGKIIKCNRCGHQTYIYYSCGNSQCPKCQGIKRLLWQDKIAASMLKVPYQHIIFTLPHQLNGIARRYPKIVFNLLLRSAWLTIKTLCAIPSNVGGVPGMISVLHTWGSDLKYHIHVHCLVTYGGLDENGNWHWPKRKNKLAKYRAINNTFRDIFFNQFTKLVSQNIISLNCDFAILQKDLFAKQWCVHNTNATTNTKVIEEYLGRYICRIGLSKNKFSFDKKHNSVTIQFNDYKNQIKGQAAPKDFLELPPLIAIDQILQHVLPYKFQKCRYYGLHAWASFKKLKIKIPNLVKQNNNTIRSIFQIIKSMLGVEDQVCEKCGSKEFEHIAFPKDNSFLSSFLYINTLNKSPPHIDQNIITNLSFSHKRLQHFLPKMSHITNS